MKSIYQTPLCSRYASKNMQTLFSEDYKFTCWRKLWIALAESQKELGLPITDLMIEELKTNAKNIDYNLQQKYESELRHDVMAQIHAYGDQCPNAKGIIHLGATSCYVVDNTDVIIMKEGLLQIRRLLLTLINELSLFATKHKALPCLAYTHFQPAQPTTVGKRATLWLYDLVNDLQRLDFELANLKLRGCKGTTGTAASFLQLFDSDKQKVYDLEKKVTQKMGFNETVSVSGQTYSRKTDSYIVNVLCGIAQSANKFSNDFRLLSHLKEFDEPFECSQVGSSAMAYKRNPMRSERIASLCRYIMVDSLNPAITAANQWFERTLDDSANKRISIPEAFLATDAVLSLYINIIKGCTVYPKIIAAHLEQELPFMATENILMLCVAKGGDRQNLHEAIRKHSLLSLKEIKENGKQNDLIARILADQTFGLTAQDMQEILDVNKFVGLSVEQTEDFIKNIVAPILENNKDSLNAKVDVTV